MIDKKVLLAVGIIFVVLIVIFFIVRMPNRVGSTRNLQVGPHEYSVEIADTMLTQARGLSGRESLAENSGMLFVFKTASMQSFWMQGMQFPLDFVWIANGKVIGITENVPFIPQTALQSPPSPADMVLEIAAGAAFKDGIRMGNVVELK